MKSFWGELGRDFWLFRFGQFISVIGDSCASIALAWWILDKTGSAAQMSAVIAPPMFVRIFLLPLFGPIGDRFSRKWIAAISDYWRALITLCIGFLVFFDIFELSLIIPLYILLSVGSALFGSVSMSIVPQLVSKEQIQKALRQGQVIQSIGTVIGGIAGGIFVTFFGIAGAFFIDGVSYLLAGIAAAFIVAQTKPQRQVDLTKNNPLFSWFQELKEGFRVLYNIPILFHVFIIAMLINFVVSPLGIVLPVLVKEARNMPAWFLGALESSVSMGAILGALTIGWMCKHLRVDFIIIAGVMLVGVGIGFMPWVPSAALPLSMMFLIGFGASCANISIGTQEAIAIPDQYRSRLNSIAGFLCQLAAPLGIALSGVLIEGFGLTYLLMGIGALVVIITPFMLFIPNFSVFFRLSPEEASSFLIKNYPKAFKN
jgi:MFS transporter, DHA3 family, macrolide efflux protein